MGTSLGYPGMQKCASTCYKPWQAYQVCIENMSSQLSDASRLEHTLQHVISPIQTQFREIGRVLRHLGADEEV